MSRHTEVAGVSRQGQEAVAPLFIPALPATSHAPVVDGIAVGLAVWVTLVGVAMGRRAVRSTREMTHDYLQRLHRQADAIQHQLRQARLAGRPTGELQHALARLRAELPADDLRRR